ncbi:MAG: hypothetical protein WCH21_09130 [Bacteroidota bacterium]
MQKIKKHIAFLLLLIFSWVLLPASIIHEVFADHIDTDCHADHEKSGAQIESIHTHCDIFETNTTLYDIPQLVVCSKPQTVILSEFKPEFKTTYFHLTQLILPTRAPPVS